MNVIGTVILLTGCSISIQGSSIDTQNIHRENVKPSLSYGLLVNDPPVAKSNDKVESGRLSPRYAKPHVHSRNGRCFSWLLGPNVEEGLKHAGMPSTDNNPIFDLDPRMNLLYPSSGYVYFPYAYSRSSNPEGSPNSPGPYRPY